MPYSHTVLITGGTTGLGYQAALTIARTHPTYLVIIASRTNKDSASERINASLHQSNVKYLPLDLGSLSAVRSFAGAWAEKSYPPIKHLLLNAGIQYVDGCQKTVDGIEMTFAVNHVGHALLFHLLFPYLTDDARIVVTSSGTHDPAQKTGIPVQPYSSAESLAHPPTDGGRFAGLARYSSSKLANVLWTYALQRRLDKYAPDRKMSVAAFDPGLMPGTYLARDIGRVGLFLSRRVGPHLIWLLRMFMGQNVHTPAVSGENLAWLAMEAKDEIVRGNYFEMRRAIQSSEASYDLKKQEDLWRWTISKVAMDEEKETFDF